MREFQKGMDISFLPELEADGIQIKDFDGRVMEPFDLLVKYGVNAARLRLWNHPENVPETKGYCNLAHSIAMAKRIKEHKLSFLLDFHYSDYWADPGQQRKPADWANLSFEELKEAVYSFTRDTLLAMQAENVLPDMVQIGNEIRSGLLFPEGELPDYGHMVELVNAGIRGARAVAGAEQMQVMIHLDQGGRYSYLKEWFDKSFGAGLLDFDLIGLSYYPFWHGTYTDLRETMKKLIQEYHKPIMIVETAHAWRKAPNGFIDDSQEKIAGIPATPQGQHKVLDLVMNITASMPEEKGCGVYYWEPLCIPRPEGSGWSEHMGLLDQSGTVMEGIRAFGFTRKQLRAGEPAKVYDPEQITIQTGAIPKLPEMLSVLFYDGSLEKRKVLWQTEEACNGYRNPGSYIVKGQVQDTGLTACCRIEAVTEIPKRTNLFADANWEEGMAQWNCEKSEEQVEMELIPEFEIPFPAPPVNTLYVKARRNFKFSISQQANISREGYYNLQVEYKGTDTTNVNICLFLENDEGRSVTMIHPTEHSWGVYVVKHVFCRPQEITAGIEITAPPVYGMMRKFQLFQVQDEENERNTD